MGSGGIILNTISFYRYNENTRDWEKMSTQTITPTAIPEITPHRHIGHMDRVMERKSTRIPGIECINGTDCTVYHRQET